MDDHIINLIRSDEAFNSPTSLGRGRAILFHKISDNGYYNDGSREGLEYPSKPFS